LWLSLFTYKNVTMRKLLLILSIIILSSFGEIAAWGKIGHRTIGEIAQRQLSLTAEQRINEILNGQSLAVVSTWADEMRSNPEFDNFSKWHYINLPIDKEYDEIEVKQENVIMIIDRAVAILKSPSADKKMKSFYLKYLVHMVGDLHQPLHTGREEDWGGNKIKITGFGAPTNLHSLWDVILVNQAGLSYPASINRLKPKGPRAPATDSVQIMPWLQHSFELARTTAYRHTNGQLIVSGDGLNAAYIARALPMVEGQLTSAAHHLASLLTQVANGRLTVDTMDSLVFKPE